MTAVEWLEEELKANLKKVILEGDSELMESLFEQSKEMEKRALAIITKFVNEFDEEGEVSWNTRDEAQNFLNNV